MTWSLIFILITIASLLIVAYSSTNDSSFMNFSACLFIAAIIFAIFQFIVDANDKDPMKYLTYIQRYELIEKCMNIPECQIEEMIGTKNVGN